MTSYQLADFTPYDPSGTATINGNSVTISVSRNQTKYVGFKIPLTDIPDYQIATYLMFNFVVAKLAAAVGYVPASGTFIEFVGETPFQNDMIVDGEYIIPCIRLKAPALVGATVTFTMPPLVVTYPSGKKIYLGSDQVQAVYLGDQEVSNVFLGTEEV